MKIVGKLLGYVYNKALYCYQRNEEERYIKLFNCKNNTSKIVFPCKIIGSENIVSGNNLYIGANSRVEAICEYANSGQKFSPSIYFGDNVSIQGNCHIGAINEIRIGNNVLMGNSVFITDHSHGNSSVEEADIAPTKRPLFSKGAVNIEDNVWLCERVTILPSVKIGRGAIVAANAVVTTDIPEYCIAGGVPAKVIKYLK